ncbi:TRAP transporter small permease [Nitratireductor alexandrii]|uniref:TRAP transporter small permease n=1 Tax=Nitratireductor alexandrii TaxID=2448161 RepID=UPI000FDB7117|nr:TRAP transporter small permease [Nitratireductor alexandrii]MCB1714341.1 TRAP transporter small permease [Candidatus Competibacteraceae bacterium]MCB1987376.1 TRAP transporter small permease [Burkholderiaceae bacterium]
MQESSFFARVDRVCFAFLKLLVGVSFCLMIFSVFLSIVMREFGFEGFPWLEEASQYLVVWSVFLSAAVLARRNEHISIDIFYSQSSPRTRKIINVLSALLGIGLIGYLAYMGWGFSYTAYVFNDVSLSGYLPVWVAYVSIPVGLGLTALAYLLWLADVLKGQHQ